MLISACLIYFEKNKELKFFLPYLVLNQNLFSFDYLEGFVDQIYQMSSLFTYFFTCTKIEIRFYILCHPFALIFSHILFITVLAITLIGYSLSEYFLAKL